MRQWLLPIAFAIAVFVVGFGRSVGAISPVQVCDSTGAYCQAIVGLGFATSMPTGGVGVVTAAPVQVAAATVVNSGASAVFVCLYNTASTPSLGTTPCVKLIEAPAGSTQPFYIPPTVRQYFPTGLAYGCATTYLGSTGCAQNTIWLDVSY